MMKDRAILLVDDDREMGIALADILSAEGYQPQWIGNGSDALKKLAVESFDLVLLDLLLPGMNGLDVLKQIREVSPSTVVIMVSGHGTIRTAVDATRLGAFDWIEKPLEKERLFLTIRNALDKSALVREREVLLCEVKDRYRMVGSSAALLKICRLIDKVAMQNVTTLITGESGTGKELVARAIHLNSRRAAGPFVCVNCAAVPETLIESELFGHTKGAFTGAVAVRLGKFQLANNGTIFLDEIGDLSAPAQAKVLRVMDAGETVMVGGERTETVDVRVISATNKNLKEMVRNGSFREDLYHRINVIEILVPPLRERPEDIMPIARHFMDAYSTQKGTPAMTFEPGAEAMLLSYSWPGNVRELRNIIEKITVLVDSQTVTGPHVAQIFEFPGLENDPGEANSLQKAKESFEKSYLLHTLARNRWNVSKAAEILGISRSALYEKMGRYGIKEPDSGFPEK